VTNWDPTEHRGYIEVERIFTEEFRWPVRRINDPDTGVDRLLEVGGDPVSMVPGRVSVTGRLLGLQIKSGESFFRKRIGDAYIYRATKSEYDYWVNYSLPVLLILHNPIDRSTFWQVVTRQTAKLARKRYRIDVPTSNVLAIPAKSAIERLAATLSPSDAVRLRREILEEKDPRFRIRVRAEEQQEFVEITARDEPVNINLSLKLSAEKLKRLFDDGEAIDFEADETIRFEGSPLFDELNQMNPRETTFRTSNLAEAWLNISIVDEKGEIMASLPPIKFMVSAGRVNATCSGVGCDGLVSVEFKMPMDGSNPATPPKISFNLNRLKGSRLRDIPNLDRIVKFLDAARKYGSIRTTCSFQGNTLFRADAKVPPSEFDLVYLLCEALANTRALARSLAWDTVIDEMKIKTIYEANRVYELFITGETIELASNVTATTTAKLTKNAAEISVPPSEKYQQIALANLDPHMMPFWGKDLNVGPVLLALTSARTSISPTDLKKKIGEQVRIELVGSDDCKIVRRRQKVLIKPD